VKDDLILVINDAGVGPGHQEVQETMFAISSNANARMDML